MDAEIGFHLESRINDLVAQGHSPERARAQAEREFGDVGAARRELAAVDRRRQRHQRFALWSDALAQDLRFALRSLRRSQAFTITAVVTLMIGIGACEAIFGVLNSVLLRPLPYGHPDRLVAAHHDFPPIGLLHSDLSASTYFTYARLAHTIDGIGLYDESAVNVSYPGDPRAPERVASATVTGSLFPLLEVPPLLGRIFTDAEDRPNGPLAAIISEGMWRAQFNADPHVVGRTLDVNGSIRQIVGVMPERFHFPAPATALWVPMGLDPVILDAKAFTHHGIVRLKPGVSAAAAQRDFAAVLPRVVELFPKFVPGISTQQIMDQTHPRPSLVPLRDDVTGSVAPTLWMVAAAAALVLLVACANVANLALVRADARQRELSVREALGAGRARVALSFLAESVVLTAGAGALGLACAALAMRWLAAAGPANIPRLAEVRINASTVLFGLITSVMVAILCAAVPALRVLRGNRSLAQGNRSETAGRVQQALRGALVVGQIALALLVLAASGLLMRTFGRLHAVQPGFDAEHLATFWTALPRVGYATDTTIAQFYAQLTDRVGHLPGVTSVGLTSRLPLTPYGYSENPIYPADDASYGGSKLPPLQLIVAVSADYFRTMKIPLLVGRTFDARPVQTENVAIVSRQTAAFFWHDPTGVAALGKQFRQLPNAPAYTVIGVVGDVRDTSLAAPTIPTVYFPEAVVSDGATKPVRRTMALVARTVGDPGAINQSVARIVHDLDATLPTFDVQPMTTAFAHSMALLQLIIVILGFAAAVTLLLGTVGLYGVLAYLVTLRTREFGIRMALGATPRSVAAATARYGIGLTVVGVTGGLVVFALVARFLRAFLYGVTANDPLTLVGASLVLLAIAAVASWTPAHRAARVDPADTLRAQ